jgi:outer membrane lipoprotein LolB
MKIAQRAIGVVILLIALAACQTRPIVAPDTKSENWLRDADQLPVTNQGLRDLTSWQYSAKVGLSINGKAEQANLDWVFHDQSNQIRLFGPLGSGTVKLEFDQFGAQITDNKGRVYIGNAAEGRDAQQLLTEVVGWPIPVNALAFWLFVLPAPEAAFEYQLDQVGQVTALRQLGWRISYADYRDYGGQLLPRKITAFKSFADARLGKVRVRLIAKDWRFNDHER